MTVGAADYGRRMSPRQNRVTPTGQIVAIPLRGSWLGNRGILHDDAGRVIRNHASQLWIICRLSFRGRRAAQWQPHRYTVLFFHDEAVALAAGHRPCGECRHADYLAYREAVSAAVDAPLRAGDLNRRLAAERGAADDPQIAAVVAHVAAVVVDEAAAVAGEAPPLRHRVQCAERVDAVR